MKSIYEDTYPTRYDLRENHIYWSINGVDYSDLRALKKEKEGEFIFDYRIDKEIPFNDFNIEVQLGLLKLFSDMKRPLAICLSGRDSEIIAREAIRLNIPCKAYFLNMWDINLYMLDVVKDICDDIKMPLSVVRMDQTEIEETFASSIKISGLRKPTYALLPYLFDRIPENELIVVGEGDLNNVHDKPDFRFLGGPGIPILPLEITHRIWAQKKKRWGQYYFYSSTPELILSAYNDPLTEKDFPNISTQGLYQKHWPKLFFKDKTTNWETRPDLKKQLKSELDKNKRFTGKNVFAGTVVPEISVKV